jgi:hypothetical protein
MAIVTDAPTLTVQTGGLWNETTDLAAVSWTAQPHVMPGEVTRREGATPDSFTFLVPLDPSQSGPAYPAVAVKNYSTRAANGQDGYLPVAAAAAAGSIRPFELVSLLAGATRVFVGIVTGYRVICPEDSPEYVEITAEEIARWHMARIGLYGSLLYRHLQKNCAWQVNALEVFNPGGKPNMALDPSGTKLLAFGPTGLNFDTETETQRDTNLGYCDWWTPGDVWNYLRAQYGLGTGNGGVKTVNYLTWPEATVAAKWTPLYQEDNGAYKKAMDLPLTGMSLADALDALVRSCGPCSWGCYWDDAAHKYQLTFWDSRTGDLDGSILTLSRGTLGASVGSTPPDVVSAEISFDWDAARNRVKALGAKKRFDVTVGSIGGTLQRGWTVGDGPTSSNAQAKWIEHPADQRRDAYPDVFLVWYIAEVASSGSERVLWDGILGDSTYCYDGRRPLLAELVSKVLQTGDQEAVAESKVRVQCWRSWDAGGTWVPMPDNVQIELLPEGGIRFSANARDPELNAQYSIGSGGSPYTVIGPWSWNGDFDNPQTPDIMVTISVEIEERATSSTSPVDATGNAAPLAHWPTLEHIEDAADRYQYHARRAAYLRARDRGVGPWLRWVPIHGTITDAEVIHAFGQSADDPVVDQRPALYAVAGRLLSERARPAAGGALTVAPPGMNWSVRPGDFVDQLTGGGLRPTITLNAVVTGVRFAELDSVELRQEISFD